MQEQLFISDIHLSDHRPSTVELFLRFLRQRATEAKALYILGDLFDAWVGDDDPSTLATEIKQALNELSLSGTTLYIQQGNRDFLIGEAFTQQSGAQLLSEEHTIILHGQRTLLMHGDLLCSDDHEYQKARAFLRSPAFQADFCSKPLKVRTAIAAEYRQRSGEAISLKPQEIMDVNQESVAHFMQKHSATLLIHGHTHRPAIHSIHLNRGAAKRLVLGAWEESEAQILTTTTDTLCLETIT